MSSDRKSSRFDAVFAAGDPLGLLAVKSAGAPRSTDEQIAIGKFEAINVFIDRYGVLPGSSAGGREPELSEYALETHLETFREGDKYREILVKLDRHSLLGSSSVVAEARNMDQIIASDDALLKTQENSIFELKHVAAPVSKAIPDDIAQRRACDNFDDYRPIFSRLAEDLASGKRTTKRFEREGSIREGASFILNGIMSYVVSVNEPHRRGKETDARLSLVFANGTESNHLLRSFARLLYDDDNGRQIIETSPSIFGPLFSADTALLSNDEHLTGSIYVVESLSPDPSISALSGRLYKIGFTSRNVQERLSDVAIDPTFLLAPVRIVAVFNTVNLNPGKLEKLLHQFFEHARLQVNVLLGRKVNPREWFVVPLELVREAIGRILDGSIVNFRYDSISRKIVPR